MKIILFSTAPSFELPTSISVISFQEVSFAKASPSFCTLVMIYWLGFSADGERRGGLSFWSPWKPSYWAKCSYASPMVLSPSHPQALSLPIWQCLLFRHLLSSRHRLHPVQGKALQCGFPHLTLEALSLCSTAQDLSITFWLWMSKLSTSFKPSCHYFPLCLDLYLLLSIVTYWYFYSMRLK